MSRLGVSEEVAELAIGHVRRGLVGTYNKDQGRRELTHSNGSRPISRMSSHQARSRPQKRGRARSCPCQPHGPGVKNIND